MWTANQIPYFSMSDRSQRGMTYSCVMSLPAYNTFVSPVSSLNETTYRSVLVKLKEPENEDHTAELIKNSKAAFNPIEANGIKIVNFFDDKETTQQVESILDSVFGVIIFITMFLCFFSLCSSMSANLMDQTKEIGVMRAMGYTRFAIMKLYFYEAFILVISSSMSGVMIGTIVGFTMVL